MFISTDLSFLHTAATDVHRANPRLPGFIAHDRAGFGGALMSAAVAIILISLWGWRRGERWVWRVLATGATAGFATTLAIHVAIGYTSLPHLWPVLLAAALTATALTLARPFSSAPPRPSARRHSPAPPRSRPFQALRGGRDGSRPHRRPHSRCRMGARAELIMKRSSRVLIR